MTDEPRSIGTYDALGFRFEVACDTADLAAVLARVLRPLSAAGPADHRYDVAWSRGRGLFLTHLDGERLASSPTARVVVEELVWWVNRAATETWPGVLLHGGAVSDPGTGAVLVIGASGAGKSTLTAALVEDGLDYLTDELVALDQTGTMVTAYPRSISLKAGSWPLLPHLAPDTGPPGSPQPSIWFVDPDRIRAGSVARRAPASLLVLLEGRGAERRDLVLVRRRPAEAVVAAVEQSFGLGPLGQSGLDVVATLCRAVPAVALAGGSLEERVAAVRSVLADPHRWPRRVGNRQD